MPFSFQINTWDSDFFGFNVATIEGDGDPENYMEDFGSLIATLKHDACKLAYWFFETADERKLLAAEAYNGTPALVRLTHQISIDHKTSQHHFDNIERIKDWDEKLFELILSCGAFSRFKTDPHFGETLFMKMYRMWTEKMLAENIVLVAKENNMISGCAALEIRDKNALYHFLAVDENYRSRGIANALTKTIIRMAADSGCSAITAYTHKINAPVWKILEREGFIKTKEENIFHFWL